MGTGDEPQPAGRRQRWGERPQWRDRPQRGDRPRWPDHPPWGGRRPPWAEHPVPDAQRRGSPGGAVFVGVVQVVGAALSATDVPPQGYALLLAGPAALLVRRRFPLFALLVAAAAWVAYETLDYPNGPTFLAVLFALIGAVRAENRWQAAIVLALGFVVYVIAGRAYGSLTWGHILAVGAWTIVAYGFAEAIRVKSAQAAAMARAHEEEKRAEAEQERAAEEQQRRQAIEERLRIARELHDVLGHHLSLINVQAGVGLHLLEEHPEQARAALKAIKQASSEALGEVRGVLAALRPQGEAAPKTPAPGLADVADLVAAAGLPVELTVEGMPAALPPDLDRAAYRIVQEALTNVRRHGGADAAARLTIAYGPDRLGMKIVNNCARMDEPAQGNGIAGMRERATALGGTLRAGPRAEGGFEVVADLPVRAT